MKPNSLRNLWISITRTLGRANTQRRSNHSRGGRKDISRCTETSKTPDPTGCETNLSAISDLTSDPKEEDWPTDDSFIMEPDFSDPMSDDASENIKPSRLPRLPMISEVQQTKQEVRRTRPNGYKNSPK